MVDKLYRRPRVFVTNLGKYIEGELVGKWIDLPCSEVDFIGHLKDIEIDGEIYEEYFITDTEYLPRTISQYSSLPSLNLWSKISIAIINKIVTTVGTETLSESKLLEIFKSYEESAKRKYYEDGYLSEEIVQQIEKSILTVSTVDNPQSAVTQYGYIILEKFNFLGYNSLSEDVKNYLDIERISKETLYNEIDSTIEDDYIIIF